MLSAENDITSVIKNLHSISFNPIISGLNSSEYFLLKVLMRSYDESNENGVRVSDIAKNMHLSAPSVTKILNTLEKKEFIIREIDKVNRRNTLVRVTEKGAEIKQINDSKLAEVMKNVYDRVGRENIVQFLHLAEIIRTAMDDEIKCFTDNHIKT